MSRMSSLGPWLFACVALVLVAALAWRLGRGRAAGLADRGATAPALTAAAPAAAPINADLQAAGSSAGLDSALAHDLRAPLRVVEGFSRILKEDYGRQLDRIGNDHLDRVLAAAARMNGMIDAMLAMARLAQTPLQRQPVNLSQLAGFIVDDFRRQAPERRIEIDIEPGLIATGDPTLLRQVLENLLGNAFKYTGRNEAAQVRFGRADLRAGAPCYEVCDNGAGFDMRQADRLFGMFQRLHGGNEFPGTGVGLASVQRIVQRHGGQVWAESSPGAGARFYFTLPG
jgi:signal transduction histidine kinase